MSVAVAGTGGRVKHMASADVVRGGATPSCGPRAGVVAPIPWGLLLCGSALSLLGFCWRGLTERCSPACQRPALPAFRRCSEHGPVYSSLIPYKTAGRVAPWAILVTQRARNPIVRLAPTAQHFTCRTT
jgi:hypothetical protein